MKLQNEKGVVGADVVVGIIIFLIGSLSALMLYTNMYSVVKKIKINEELIGYITDIFEKVDDELYDNINEERMEEIIASSNIPEAFELEYSITNYKDTVEAKGGSSAGVEDLVKRITLNVKYSIDHIDRNYTIGRIKVREL